MAPSIRTSKSTYADLETKSDVSLSPSDAPDAQLPVATQELSLSIPEPVKAIMAQIKQRIEATHDYVGDTFAREVRAMHEGETQHRPIYGEATPSQVRALIEDEIPVAPLPMLASPKGIKGIN